jgi:hypothetical protein
LFIGTKTTNINGFYFSLYLQKPINPHLLIIHIFLFSTTPSNTNSMKRQHSTDADPEDQQPSTSRASTSDAQQPSTSRALVPITPTVLPRRRPVRLTEPSRLGAFLFFNREELNELRLVSPQWAVEIHQWTPYHSAQQLPRFKSNSDRLLVRRSITSVDFTWIGVSVLSFLLPTTKFEN